MSSCILPVLRSKMYSILKCISDLTPDNPLLHGWSSYSQCDEDGIIRDCLRRISLNRPLSNTFVEIGCGDGLENNTHQLVLDGFAGIWIDGASDNIRRLSDELGGVFFSQLLILEKKVDVDNSSSLASACKRFLGGASIDFLSLDIDGNDEHVCSNFVDHLSPKLVCVEYNAKFPPPTCLTMTYNASHNWSGGDYFGSSLQAWVEFFTVHGFTLVCCNITGANAFFVKDEYLTAFTVYPVSDLYQPARYHLIAEKNRATHPPTLGWLKQALADPVQRVDALVPDDKVLIAKTDYGDMLVYKRDSVIGASLIGTGSFQEGKIAEVARFLNKRDAFIPRLFVDIGANIGTHTIYALNKLGIERAVCFEPEPGNFDLLLLNTAKSGLSGRVESNRVALSDRTGDYEMELSNTNYGDHRIKASTTHLSFGEENERRRVSVPFSSLDDYAAHSHADWHEALVWIDTQGHEGHIFSGGQRFFSSESSPRYIVAEFWPYGIERATGFEKYFEFLARCKHIYDINATENGEFQSVTIENLKLIYNDMLSHTEKEIHPHTDLLLVR